MGSRVTLSVTVLGCSGMYATPSNAASGYLIEFDDTRLWLDAGPGTWRHLLRHIDYTDLDGVVLTHRHPDHTTDVFQAFHARYYGGPDPLVPIPLWAPGETLERICGFDPDMTGSFKLEQLSAGQPLTLGSATLTFVSMVHPPETLGVRIEHEGAVFAYSADTGPTADFAALASDADLFICEATLQEEDGGWEGHMLASETGSAALSVGARRLLLTHLPPDRDWKHSLEQARAVAGDLPVDLAADDMTLEVSK
jgi:ribonuclease BN (tRNA processing enzyme)